MRIYIDVCCVLEAGEPRRWSASVFTVRLPGDYQWVGSTAAYTTQREMWAEAKRIVRSAAAIEEFDNVA